VTCGNACGLDRQLRCIPRMSHTARIGLRGLDDQLGNLCYLGFKWSDLRRKVPASDRERPLDGGGAPPDTERAIPGPCLVTRLSELCSPWLAVVRYVDVGTRQLDFAEFYRESKDACLFAVLVSVGDRDVAQDLVDEAFARAWASWRSVSRHSAPAAWVVRTALNASISRWRKCRREVSLPEPGKVADLVAVQEATDSPLDPRIMAALTRLPARQRQVVAMRLLLDLDTSTTAEVLGISPSAVKAHLARAIAVLRSDLMPERQQESPS
jgi:RNA polymerase sigma factor (sigma-70 family)